VDDRGDGEPISFGSHAEICYHLNDAKTRATPGARGSHEFPRGEAVHGRRSNGHSGSARVSGGRPKGGAPATTPCTGRLPPFAPDLRVSQGRPKRAGTWSRDLLLQVLVLPQ